METPEERTKVRRRRRKGTECGRACARAQDLIASSGLISAACCGVYNTRCIWRNEGSMRPLGMFRNKKYETKFSNVATLHSTEPIRKLNSRTRPLA